MNVQNLTNSPLTNNYERVLRLVTRSSEGLHSDLDKTDKACSLLESEIIFAFLNGNFHDKEILDYLSQFKYVKYSSVRYNFKKVLTRFDTNSRSELFRKLLFSKYLYLIPESIYQILKHNHMT